MAALLQIYSLTIVSEIDTENSLGWCVALAEATLEVPTPHPLRTSPM